MGVATPTHELRTLHCGKFLYKNISPIFHNIGIPGNSGIVIFSRYPSICSSSNSACFASPSCRFYIMQLNVFGSFGYIVVPFGMDSLNEFRLPVNFLESVGNVNTATDAAAARVDGCPAAMGDITAAVDRVALPLIDNIKSSWIRALAIHDFDNRWLPEWNPSDLHRSATTQTRKAANTSVPADLAVIIDDVAHLKEQAQAWLNFVSQHGIFAYFTALLKMWEVCYVAMRTAAQLADLIQIYKGDEIHPVDAAEIEASQRSVDDILHLLDEDWQALYLCDIKPMMNEGCILFRQQHIHEQVRQVAPSATYVGFESLGEVGSEPSFELACQLAMLARSAKAHADS